MSMMQQHIDYLFDVKIDNFKIILDKLAEELDQIESNEYELEIQNTVFNIQELSKQFSIISKKFMTSAQDSESKIKSLKEMLAEADNNILEIENKYKKEVEMSEQLSKDKIELRKEITNIENIVGSQLDELSALRTKNNEHEKNMHVLKNNVSYLTTLNEANSKNISQHVQKIKVVEKELNHTYTTLAEQQQINISLEEDIKKLNKHIDELTYQLNDVVFQKKQSINIDADITISNQKEEIRRLYTDVREYKRQLKNYQDKEKPVISHNGYTRFDELEPKKCRLCCIS